MSHIKSLKLIDWCFIAFVVLKLAWDLLTLASARFAWYDEVYFASITDSLIHGNGLTESCYGFGGKCSYGPVYFLLTAFSTFIFGFNAFGFRIVAMAAFYGCAFLFLHILKLCRIPKCLAYIGTALFLLATSLAGSANSGRMELVAIFFVLLGYVFYIRGRQKQRLLYLIWVSLSFSLAALTTPRSIVVMLPLSLYIVVSLLRHKQWLPLALFILVPAVAGSSWILYEYGSFYRCWLHYFGKKDYDANGDFVSFFLGGVLLGGNCRGWSNLRYVPVLLCWVVSVVASVTKRKWENFIFIAPVLSYALFVDENGSYRAYGSVFICLTVFIGYQAVCQLKPHWRKIVFLCLSWWVAVSLILFVRGVANVLQEQSAIHENMVNEWVQTSIEPHSVVLSDDAYFYALRKHDCIFRRLSHEWYKRETYHKKLEATGKPAYILILNDGESSVPEFYTTELIGEYRQEVPEQADWVQYLYPYKKYEMHMRSYSGKLYRIISPELSDKGNL